MSHVLCQCHSPSPSHLLIFSWQTTHNVSHLSCLVSSDAIDLLVSSCHRDIVTMTIAYRSLNGTAPHYLTADLWRCLTFRPDDVAVFNCRRPSFAVAGAWFCNQILLRSTHCHGSVKNSNYFYSDSHILLSCFSFSLWTLQFLPRPH